MWLESRFCLRTDRTRGQTWARGVAAAPGLCHRRLGRRTCLPQSSCQTSKASPGRTASPALWPHRRCPTTSRSTGPALTQQQVPSTPKAPVMPARALEECNSLILRRSLTMWHESRFFAPTAPFVGPSLDERGANTNITPIKMQTQLLISQVADVDSRVAAAAVAVACSRQ